MNLSISKHKTPIVVTAVGLLVATGLAIAPGIMAGSETDKLAEKNSADIEKLLATVEANKADLEAQVMSISKQSEGTLSSYGNQIQTLNKATTRLHRKQRAIQEPNGEIRTSISQLAKNADARIINLEKAVVQLHRRQRESNNADTPDQAPVNESELSVFDNRLAELEKIIVGLQENKNNAPKPSQSVVAGKNEQGIEWRITALERTVRQFTLNQKLMDTAGSTRLETAIRKDIETDLQIKALERSLTHLEARLDNLDNDSRRSNQIVDRRYDPVVDQLFEIRNTVNSLLNEISR